MGRHVVIPLHPDPARPELRLPPQLDGLRRLAYNLYWTWHPEVRVLFRARRRGAPGRATATRSPSCSGTRDWSRLLDDTDFMVRVRRRSSRASTPTWRTAATTGSQRQHGEELSGPIAYFCAEYGLHESLGIYSGGLGVLAGDHLQDGLRHGPALRRRRPLLPPRLLPPDHRRRRPPGARLPRLRPCSPAAPAGRRRRAASRSLVPVELPGRTVHAAVWLAQVGRVPLLLLDTDVPENDEADRPITHILYVRGREMRLHQEMVLGVGGVRALRALGIEPVRLAPQRGPLRVHARRAGPRADRRRRQPGGGPRAASGATRCSPSTRRSRPATSASTPTSCATWRRRSSRAPASTWSASSSSVAGRRRPRQFDMTAFSLREHAGANAVSQLHADTANGPGRASSRSPSWASPTASTRRPGWASRCARLFRDLGARPGPPDDETRETGSGSASTTCPTRDLWDAHKRQKRELAVSSPGGRLRRQFARHGESPAALDERRRRPRPRRPDHRLRPPLRDLQAGGAPLQRRGAPGAPALGPGAPGADRLRRQGPSRPTGPASASSATSSTHPAARTRSRGRVFILEDYDMRIGALPRAGRRRLAEQPAPAARGARHQRHEGGHERRHQPLGPRRLVGRGLTRRQWLGHRRSRGDRRRGCAGLGRRADALPDSSRRRSCRAGTSATRTACRAPGSTRMKASIATSMWRFSTTRMLEEYVEQLYLPAAASAAATVSAATVGVGAGRARGRADPRLRVAGAGPR